MKGRGILLIVLVIALIWSVISIFQMRGHIHDLEARLSGMRIFDWRDTLAIVNGYDSDAVQPLFTNDYISGMLSLRSPFKDERGAAEIIGAYLKNRYDRYGERRRSGEVIRIHEGIDLYVPEDTPVFPMAPVGIVTDVSDDPDHEILAGGHLPSGVEKSVMVGYGKIVRILYPEGFETLYAHLNEVYVQKGQIVTADMAVGSTGMTGNIKESGKPSHLHLEFRGLDGKSFDPEYRLDLPKQDLLRFTEALQNATSVQTVQDSASAVVQ